jgi:hypothetical protein
MATRLLDQKGKRQISPVSSDVSQSKESNRNQHESKQFALILAERFTVLKKGADSFEGETNSRHH